LALTLLASCASTKSDKVFVAPLPPVLSSPDSALVKLCNVPVDLGSEALVQAQIEKLWSTDRANLARCLRKHKALVDFLNERDRLLMEAVK